MSNTAKNSATPANVAAKVESKLADEKLTTVPAQSAPENVTVTEEDGHRQIHIADGDNTPIEGEKSASSVVEKAKGFLQRNRNLVIAGAVLSATALVVKLARSQGLVEDEVILEDDENTLDS